MLFFFRLTFIKKKKRQFKTFKTGIKKTTIAWYRFSLMPPNYLFIF